MKWLQRQGPPGIINVLALLPLLWLVADVLLGRLSANPIRDIQDRTGLSAIGMLTVSLASTPAHRLLGFSWLRTLRRLAGLYAFGYAGLHLLNLLGLDYGFNLTFLRQDILVKRYILAGLAAFICLLPVAITSTAGWQRRLGRKWRGLHRLVYLAGLLAVIHFFWQAKIDQRLPFTFAILIIILLVARLPSPRRFIRRVGKRPAGGQT